MASSNLMTAESTKENSLKVKCTDKVYLFTVNYRVTKSILMKGSFILTNEKAKVFSRSATVINTVDSLQITGLLVSRKFFSRMETITKVKLSKKN